MSRRAAQILRQRPIRQCFRQMQPADFVGSVEIGQRARDAQHAVIAARRQPHGFGRIAQQLCARSVGLGDLLQQRGRCLRIGADVRQAGGRVTRQLDVARGDFRRALRKIQTDLTLGYTSAISA